MATTTTNFGWDIPQSTDLVKDGATAIAALGQDIDTAFVDFKGGTTGQVLKKTSGTDLDVEWGTASSGLTLINTTSFSAVASVSLPQDSFTTTYDNYRIIFAFTQSVSGTVDVRMRLAGTDNTASSYQVQRLDLQGTSFANSRSTGTTAGIGQGGTSGPQVISADIYGPKLAQNTLFRSVNVPTDGADILMREVVGRHTVATAFDSMTFISNGTFTGTATLYGYNK